MVTKRSRKPTEFRLELWQNGERVATAEGYDAEREINHYGFIYSQDGPVEIKRVPIRRTRRAK